MRAMTKWERVEAAMQGGQVDRIPISLWKHYHLQDRAPKQLAEISLALYKQFDIDLIKLTPSGLYPIQDWGGAIRFGRDDDSAPVPVQPVINTADQWQTLPSLDVTKGALQRELETIHYVAAGLDGAAPFMMTIFSPLTIAYKLCQDEVSGERVVDHLRHTPRQLHAGLATIRDVVIDYAAACLEAGASGFFFATQMATHGRLTGAEYAEFGSAYDLPILESLAGKSKVTMLHVCGKNLIFDQVADYPVDVINWADRSSGLSLAEGRKLTKRSLAGGLSLQTLRNGSEDQVRAEVEDAVTQVGKTSFILAPACVVAGPSPDRNLMAARQAAEAVMD